MKRNMLAYRPFLYYASCAHSVSTKHWSVVCPSGRLMWCHLRSNIVLIRSWSGQHTFWPFCPRVNTLVLLGFLCVWIPVFSVLLVLLVSWIIAVVCCACLVLELQRGWRCRIRCKLCMCEHASYEPLQSLCVTSLTCAGSMNQTVMNQIFSTAGSSPRSGTGSPG